LKRTSAFSSFIAGPAHSFSSVLSSFRTESMKALASGRRPAF